MYFMPGRGASGLVVALTFASLDDSVDLLDFLDEATLVAFSDFAAEDTDFVAEPDFLDTVDFAGAEDAGLVGGALEAVDFAAAEDAGLVGGTLDAALADSLLTTVVVALTTVDFVVTTSLPFAAVSEPATVKPLRGTALIGIAKQGATRQTGIGVKSIVAGGGAGAGGVTDW
jgi:hypothetical protein